MNRSVETPNSKNCLVVTGLVKNFGGVAAVQDATFNLPLGSVTGLIGPNGAGKSTVLGIIGGQIIPDAGSIQYSDSETVGLSPHRLAQQGILRTFQQSSEFASLTVLENLMVAPLGQLGERLLASISQKRRWRAEEERLLERAHQLLTQFFMTRLRDEAAGNLSGGQRRLLEIMRALMAEPLLLLLDEPLAGVSPLLVPTILAHLERLRDDGLTMLVVEHDLAAVERVCNPVVIMAGGRVLAQGSLSDLRSLEEVRNAYLVG